MLTNLETLDVADNMIRTITGLSALPHLRTLNISGNKLSNLDDIMDLAACTALQSLDVSSNKLEDTQTVDFVIGLPLLFLRMMGNPVVSQYR
jgi:Leucine-rich repeat (LRR) protein